LRDIAFVLAMTEKVRQAIEMPKTEA